MSGPQLGCPGDTHLDPTMLCWLGIYRPPDIQKIGPELHKFDAIINQSSVIEEGTPVRYHLKLKTESHDPSEPYKKMTFGQRDKNKPHKIILMVGETGTGKTKLINTMINYMLGVQREDKVWFEITDDQSDRTLEQSQTSIITVYEFYLQESPIHLTIIDTPGYGDTRGAKKDEISESLLRLSKSAEGIHVIDAVCLVIKATQNRLSDRQIYIFDAVQSLFGKDIVENIVLLFTHSRGAIPKNVMMAVEEAKIKCAVNDENQPVYFLFDNCQSEPADEDEEDEMLKQSWDLSCTEITGFFKFLDNIKAKTLKMTKDVLQKRKKFEANISKIKSHIQDIDQKQNQLKETQEALEQHKKVVEENKNFEFEIEVEYKEKVDIDRSVASVATCCSFCEENCHYSAWSIKDLWFSPMKADHCTVCTNKCHKSQHLKSAKVYETKTKKEKKTNKDLKKKYDDSVKKVRDCESSVKKLEEELQELEKEKIKRAMEAFHCVETLEMIALNTDSLITLQHIDFLIEKMKEINEPENVKTLENIKEKAGEKQQSIGIHEWMS